MGGNGKWGGLYVGREKEGNTEGEASMSNTKDVGKDIRDHILC